MRQQPCNSRSGRQRWRRWLSSAALLGVALGCGLTATDAVLGGETHFLGNCGGGCSDGLSCLAGICTRPCVDSATDCADLGASVSCRQEPQPDAFCDLPCTTDASCAAAGGSNLACEDGFCRAAISAALPALIAAEPDRSDPWWCLGLSPEPLPAVDGELVALVAPVVEWSTRRPLAGQGLLATLCEFSDLRCQAPLAPPLVVTNTLDGQELPPATAAVPLPARFDGHIRFDVATPDDAPEAEQFLSVDYYLGGRAVDAVSRVPAILMTESALWDAILEQSFPAIDRDAARAAGTVMATVSDCNGNAVDGARVELRETGGQPAGFEAQFWLPASRIPVALPAGEQLRSGLTGVGYVGVPASFVELRAYRPGDDQLIGQLVVGVMEGQLTTGTIRPAYLLGGGVPEDGDLNAAP